MDMMATDNDGMCYSGAVKFGAPAGDFIQSDQNGGNVFNEQWTEVEYGRRRKRGRISTGGTSNAHVSDQIPPTSTSPIPDNYDTLSVDEKLNLILSTMKTLNTLQVKIDRALGVTNAITHMEHTVNLQEDRITVLEYKSIDSEARARRNNLLFKGFPESRSENCPAAINDFIQRELGIDDKLPIDRAHRLGRFRSGQNRFIIVAFTYFQDTEYILSKGHMLRNKPYSISRDFPHEIVQARKLLWPRYKDMRSRHTGSNVNIVYPAKLVHNGKVVVDMFPQWDELMRRSRVNHTQPSGQRSPDRSHNTRAHENNQPPHVMHVAANASYIPPSTTHRDTETHSARSDTSSPGIYPNIDAETARSFAVPFDNRRTVNIETSDTVSVSSENEPESPSLISGNVTGNNVLPCDPPRSCPPITVLPPQATSSQSTGLDHAANQEVHTCNPVNSDAINGPTTTTNPD